MPDVDADRCTLTDLLVAECAHCRPGARPGKVITAADLEQLTTPETADRYRPFARARHNTPWGFGKEVTPTRGRYEPGDQFGREPRKVMCSHPSDGGTGSVCPDCWADVEICLGDIPSLIQDLQTSIRRNTAFVSHGTYRGTVTDPANIDAGPPLPYNGGAANLIRRLADAVDLLAAPAILVDQAAARLAEQMGRPIKARPLPDDPGPRAVLRSRTVLRHASTVRLHPDAATYALRLTRLVVRAHEIVDRPADWIFWGECPRCDTPIYDERDVEAVRCHEKTCGYAASITEHHRASIARRGNDLLTAGELVEFLQAAGYKITRHRIRHLVDRGGLPRELIQRPRWHADGRIRTDEVYAHRLRDVVELLGLGTTTTEGNRP